MRAYVPALLIVAGCYASAGYVGPAPVYTTSATVTTTTYDEPDLVYAEDGVQVVADYDEPVFYSDSFYWRFYGGTWYRSSRYNSGWVVYNDVPYRVRRINQPTRYVRYRPSGWTPRSERGGYVRDHRDGYDRRDQPVVRDHRGYQQPVVRDHRDERDDRPVVRDHRGPEPRPVVRDHRDDRRDDRRDRRDERRDNRDDNRDRNGGVQVR